MGDKLKAWTRLFRPWSLAATLVPFMLAAAMCEEVEPWRAAAALFAAAMLQNTVNLLNTYGDDASGVDRAEGAFVSVRAVQDGIVAAKSVRNAAIACAALAVAAGVPLLAVEKAGGAWGVNWPLAAIAAAGLWGATNYATAWKFKYRGLGVVFVFSLMGWLETMGFCHAMAARRCPFVEIFAYSLPASCLVAAILHGNDMRDMASDRAAGIRTLATTLGAGGALAAYAVLHLAAVLCAIVFAAVRIDAMFLLPLAACVVQAKSLLYALRTYRANPVAPQYRNLERHSAAAHLIAGVLWSAAIWQCHPAAGG
ncbi:MAG: prenyltransferase [Kiritimatiellae bacterium]|nr:prenyltransferase [Kiritimatiellia bacterium]